MKPLFDHYYSDPHFGHAKLLSTLRAPWGYDDVEQLDAVLIDRYQGAVEPDDTVLWLGDVSFYGAGEHDRVRRVLERLPGRKVLLRGNHDLRHSRRWWVSVGFDTVIDGQIHINLGGRSVVASHMPPLGVPHARGPDLRHPELRPKLAPEDVLIHGHTHSPRFRTDNRLHVGVDAHCLTPVSHAKILEALREAS